MDWSVIRVLRVTEPMKYLWLMYVDSVDTNEHCIKTFRGRRGQKLGKSTTWGVGGSKAANDVVLDESEIEVMYLCGVSEPYVWNKNFHLAWRRRAGVGFKFRHLGVHIWVDNAERLAIPRPLPGAHPLMRYSRYATCRNWWFSLAYASSDGRPPVDERDSYQTQLGERYERFQVPKALF